MAQTSLFDEIIVDNFAGFGGASIGIELACGRPVEIAINHSPQAILQHKTNHPYTRHYRENVWDIDPVKACAGRPVGLAWFSPDCKHFSKAKGGKPKDKRIRGLAWVACKWAALVRPRVIMLENVEEFQEWGPLGRNRKPIKAKKGQTFRKFVGQIRDLGYEVQWRELVAADYGAPTTRKRFFLIARCDGRPIVWPERTHAPINHPLVQSGELRPWRSAAEIIDWNLPCPSVFATKEEIKERYGLKTQRPLKPNTMRRIIRGVDKFTIKSGKPFIVPIGYGERKGQLPRVNSIDSPIGTVVSTGKHNVCQPMISPVTLSNTGGSVGAPASDPVHTIRTAGGQLLSAAQLIQYHTEKSDHVRAYTLGVPINTVDASNRYGLTSASLVEYYGNGKPLDVTEPMHTITARDREAVVATHIAEFKGQDIGQKAENPLRTITAGGGQFAQVKTTIVRYQPGYSLGYWPEIRALLNRYCGYTLGENEVLLLGIGGIWYFIADIGMRMLTPRELYRANGFPNDYIIDHDYQGNPVRKEVQVEGCGNAVVPALAEALVRANLPEWCGKKITTLAELEGLVAV